MGKVDTRKRLTDIEAETPDHHIRKRFRRPKKKSKGAGGFHPCTAEMLNANYTRLAASPTDLSVWEDRRSLVGQLSLFDLEKELSLVEQLADAKKHRNNYLIWDYRRWIVEKIGSESVARAIKELEITKKILSKGTKNCQAWLYREWIIRKFDKADLWWLELSFCHEILENDIFNVSAWDQICRVVRELDPNLDNELRDGETKFARETICSQPGNEGPWLYLRFLYEGDERMLYKDPNLECIYVNVLAEGADRLKSSLELDCCYDMKFASVDYRGCVHALNLIMDLMTFGYKVDHNTRLLEAVNFLLDNSRLNCRWLVGEVLSGMPREVFALMRSLDALRIRYCYKYHACFLEPRFDLRFDVEESPRIESEEMDITPLSREKFESMFYACEHVKKIKRKKQESLKERFYQTHLRKVKGQGIAEDHSLELVKWELRRFVVTSFGGASAALEELEYTTNIITKDANNHHAWSHRQWLFQVFCEDSEDKAWEEICELELDFCKGILKKDTCNIFAWDQRFYVVKRGLLEIDALRKSQILKMDFDEAVAERIEKLEEEYERKRAKEILYAKKLIASEAENPFPWCHMFGISSYYRFKDYGPKIMSAVLDAMLRVLEDARDYCGGVGLGEGGGSCINGRGVINVLNMHLDFIFNHPDLFSHPKIEEQANKIDNVLADLCLDLVETDETDETDMIFAIINRLRMGVVGHGLAWKSVVDNVLVGKMDF